MDSSRPRCFGGLSLLVAVALAPILGAPRAAAARGLQLDGELRGLGLATDAAGAQGSVPDLSLPSSWRGRTLLAEGGAAGAEGGNAAPGASGDAQPAAPKPGSLDFDLLGAPAPTDQSGEQAFQTRRTMLDLHQGVGLGMFTLQLATTVVGQLNYSDKFNGGNTNAYAAPHAVLAYTTLAAFVAAGSLALFAPSPQVRRSEGFDRVSLHKVAMFTAAAGMLAEGILGAWTQSREGYLNQRGLAQTHLVIGYVTLAAVATGIGALVL